jgi:hypothetical protein
MIRMRVWIPALLLASLAVGSCSSSDDGEQIYSAEAGLCVAEVNRYRATLALAPLARWTDAEGCANAQARSDSESGTAHGAFGKCGERAQNECPGWSGAPSKVIVDCLRSMWDEGPGGGHHDNMAGSSQRVACGFYVTPAGKVWAVQDYR